MRHETRRMEKDRELLSLHPMNDVRCVVGESPVYDAARDALWLCDIPNRRIHCFGLADGARRHWDFPSEVGSLGLANSGRLVVALRHTVALLDPETGSVAEIAHIEMERGAETRLNDGKVGPDGAFWVGTMDDRGLPKREAIGALYRVTPDGTVEKRVDGVAVSNGLAWSGDGRTMYHSDSTGCWLDRWGFDRETGDMSDRVRIATFDEATGRPDGGATDVDGFYWSAGVSAQRLNRIDRDGRIVEVYPVPVAAPTMPCFGGADRRTLFVTNLTSGRSPALLEKYPDSGLVLTAPSPVAGVPVALFAD